MKALGTDPRTTLLRGLENEFTVVLGGPSDAPRVGSRTFPLWAVAAMRLRDPAVASECTAISNRFRNSQHGRAVRHAGSTIRWFDLPGLDVPMFTHFVRSDVAVLGFGSASVDMAKGVLERCTGASTQPAGPDAQVAGRLAGLPAPHDAVVVLDVLDVLDTALAIFIQRYSGGASVLPEVEGSRPESDLRRTLVEVGLDRLVGSVRASARKIALVAVAEPVVPVTIAAAKLGCGGATR